MYESLPERIEQIVRKKSEASYGMYLMHMLMLPAVFVLLSPLLPVLLTIILTAVVTYCLSIVISRPIGKLPFGKYIVG